MKRPAPLAITVAGINHRTASVEQRECVALSPPELSAALARSRSELGGGAVLSTCNRTELYATIPTDTPDEWLVDFLTSSSSGEPLDPSHFYVLRQDEAVRHLYRVAAGLDSMVLGEAQILGQVRDALGAAHQAQSLNGVLSRLFHTAIAVGKRARSQTSIGRYAESVSSTAVALAKKTFGQLQDRTVLVVSAGSSGKLAARSLAQSGVSRILVTNRTYDRARELAQRLGGSAVPFQQLPTALAGSDIVISSSGAPGFVLGPELVAPAVASRNGHGLLLIDIAVPRDIDPTVRDIPGVHLFDIDDLQSMSLTSPKGRGQGIAGAESIVGEELARFQEWWQSLDVVLVIAALRQQAESIRRREVERLLRRLPDVSDEERQRIEAMSAAIVKKMLHEPIARLKDSPDSRRHLETLQELFGLRMDK